MSMISIPTRKVDNYPYLIKSERNGDGPLDVGFVATDGECIYRSGHNQNFPPLPSKVEFGQDAWNHMIGYIFLREEIPEEHADSASGLFAEALANETTLEIKIVRNIKGIQQQLGTLEIPKENLQDSYDEEGKEGTIQLFDWSVEAAKELQGFFQNTTVLKRRVAAQDKTILKLKDQLETLQRAKKEHEDSLFKKFSSLINTKKLKIRDQQRLLARAAIGEEQVKHTELLDTSLSAEETRPARHGKRKAPAKAHDSSSDSDAFAAPPSAGSKGRDAAETSDDDDPPSTPQPLEEETTDDEEDITMDIDPPVSQPPHPVSLPRSTRPATSTATPAPVSLPPRRELPFATKSAETVQQTEKGEEEDDGETDDDEL